MDLFNLPPIDMHIVPLRRDQQPSPKVLVGVAIVALCGLMLSWLPGGSTSPQQDSLQVASNVVPPAPLR